MFRFKFLIILSIFFLLIKIYYSIKIKNRNKNTTSILAEIAGGVYGGGVIFPIIRRPRDPEEKKIIQKANIAVCLFWILFLTTMILVLIR